MYLITYLIKSSTKTMKKTLNPKDPNVPSLRYVNVPSLSYVNVPKKTMKKTLIMYLKPTYLQHFSPDPLVKHSKYLFFHNIAKRLCGREEF